MPYRMLAKLLYFHLTILSFYLPYSLSPNTITCALRLRGVMVA
ncbi:MAG: hypothetical protein PWP64_369 [Candidatus Cloacimonadota bacterium]|nr:hypothetical protein [Candidatus Cloacimonadota bacterium]